MRRNLGITVVLALLVAIWWAAQWLPAPLVALALLGVAYVGCRLHYWATELNR